MVSRGKHIGSVLVLATVYFSFAWLGLKFTTVGAGYAAMIWPAAGVALAVLLARGYNLWPGVFLGAFAISLHAGYPLWASVCIGIGNTLEPLAALWLLQRAGFSARLERLDDLYSLLALGGIVATSISAMIGVAGLYAAGMVEPHAVPAAILYWWMGDSIGIMLLTPVLLIWRNGAEYLRKTGRLLELAVMLVASFALIRVVLGEWMAAEFSDFHKWYWLFPLLLWAALRFGRHGVSLMLAVMFSLVLWAMAHGSSHVGSGQSASLIDLWLYQLIMVVAGMTLAVVLKERQILQRQAVEGRNLLRGVIDALDDSIYFLDREMRLLGCNEAVERDLKKPEAEIVGKSASDFFPREIVECFVPINQRILQQGHTYRDTMRFNLGGNGRDCDVHKRPFRNASGDIVGIITVVRDVTGELQMQRRLAKEHAMLRGVMDSIPDLISIKDTAGAYLGCNKAVEHFFSAHEAMIIGHTDSDFVDPETAESFLMQDRAMLAQQQPVISEKWVTYPDGAKVLLETLKTPFYDARNSLLGSISVSRDITSRREQEHERELLHHAMACSLHEIYIFDSVSLRFEYCNRGALDSLGFCMDEMREMTPFDIKPFYTEETYRAIIAPLISGQKSRLVFETFHCRRDGSMYPVEVHLQCFDHDDSHVIMSIVQNISERLSTEHRLRLAAQVFDASTQGIIISNESNTIRLVNPAFTRITGYSAEEAIGRNPHFLSSELSGPNFYREMWDAINTRDYWAGEVWNRRKSGEIYPQWLEISVIRRVGGQIESHVGLFTDITERKTAEEQIRVLAQHDYLTGLPNRALLAERFAQVMALAERKNEQFGLIYLDLDHFKEVNDSFGHHVGDLLLKEVANRLRHAVRVTDTICRMGGDEFILLVPGVEGIEDIEVLADKLLDVIGEPYPVAGDELAVTPSAGIAIYPQHGKDMDTLMRRADVAMYCAKSGGRNGYRLFEAGMLPERQ